MEPECDKLIMASINKNYVDMDEYPVTTELQVPPSYPISYSYSISSLSFSSAIQSQMIWFLSGIFYFIN